MQLRPERITGPYPGKQVRDIALLLLTVLALYLCWLLASPFLAAIVWALALAVVAYPLHRRCETFLPPNVAALVSVLAVTAVLLAPGAFLLQRFFDEAVAGVRLIRHNLDPAVFPTLAERNPYFATVLHWLQATFDLNQGMKRAAGFLASQAPTVISGSVQVITQSAMMLVTLFYFLRDHRRLLGFLLRIAPLSSTESEQLVNRVSETINATLYGNLAVKLVQGLLGGLMFWIVGLPAPLLFGILMSLLAMLPVVGTSLVWGPAALVLIYQGSWIKAIILVAWGGVVISLIDNLLYPFLVATELRFHTLGVLFAVFGGLVAFGLAGVVLGPVILASTVALLEVWTQRKADAIAE
ncbi:MAG: AI-2E family transporter [Bryobacteraceae bacterium]